MLVTPVPRSARKRLPWWLVDLIIAVLLMSSAFLPFEVPGRAGANLASLPWLAVASATLPFRRRWPVAVLCVNIAIFATASIAGVVSPAFVIAPAITIFQVALTHSRRVTIWATATTAILLPLLSLIAVPAALLQPEIFISAQALQLAAIVAFAGAFGDATRSRRATLAALEERALRAEQSRDSEAGRRVAEDRLQIARDLHDLIAHQIAVINLHANVASRSVPDRPAEAEASLAVIRQASRTVLTEIGELLSALREPNGLPPAPTSAGLAQLDSLVEQFRSNGLAVTISRTGAAVSLGEFADVVAYKVVQEALTNALKHSPDRTCSLTLTGGADGLVIVIENPRTRSASPNSDVIGHGITGMRERVEIVGGSVRVQTSESFHLTVTIPAESTGAAS
jgi:signal transduction histidine kinase